MDGLFLKIYVLALILGTVTTLLIDKCYYKYVEGVL